MLSTAQDPLSSIIGILSSDFSLKSISSKLPWCRCAAATRYLRPHGQLAVRVRRSIGVGLEGISTLRPQRRVPIPAGCRRHSPVWAQRPAAELARRLSSVGGVTKACLATTCSFQRGGIRKLDVPENGDHGRGVNALCVKAQRRGKDIKKESDIPV